VAAAASAVAAVAAVAIVVAEKFAGAGMCSRSPASHPRFPPN
jgi:hypothetical protein